MNAAAIAAAFGEARREGGASRCRCPLHGGRSLVIRDGDGGRLLATCWGGCDRLDLLAELRRRGLLDRRADYTPHFIPAPPRHDDASRCARALNIWRNTQHDADTIARRYWSAAISRSIACLRRCASTRVVRARKTTPAILLRQCPRWSSTSSAGRLVCIAMPPRIGADFKDILRVTEARHVV